MAAIHCSIGFRLFLKDGNPIAILFQNHASLETNNASCFEHDIYPEELG